ncbi:prephenate dehydratase [Skermania piniformis]|uniref:Prephenate dehydratase n=1 Tax=Skermania pinensis TaxID=39122 RepID=A0ABX8SAJ4_9ACTN|nr:prephenate dehydratase [Skermania piniformis]QXQ14012.1 prephenate dehydratase [Skermania piniformis]
MPRIAYLGPSGTFTEMALDRLVAAGGFAGAVDRVGAASQPAALELVRREEAAGAVVPIESSVEGSVAATLDSLAQGRRLQIVGEVELPISFTVVARPGLARADVRTVAGYPVATAQVRHWLARELPDAESVLAASNAAAAELVAAGAADAGVSTALAGARLGLAVLADGVADVAAAVTRFVHVTLPTAAPPRTGTDRTSLVLLALPNEPGSLMRAFAEFATRGIDLTRIESRPTQTGLGSYRFHIDCVGHIDDPAIAEALKALHRLADVRYLGSWPATSSAGRPPPADDEAAGWLAGVRKGVEG